MPLYEQIKAGNVGFLLQAFNQRKAILLERIRQGGKQADFLRWQACVEALDAVCAFLNKQQVKGKNHGN